MKGHTIGMVHWCYPPTIGGVETFLEQLAGRLVERGNKVHVVTGDRCGRSVENKIVVHGTDVLGDYRNRIVTREEYWKCHSYFTRFIRKNRIDILHAHNFQRNFRPGITMALYCAAVSERIPVALHVHNPVVTPEAALLVSKIPWSGVFCVSNWITEHVRTLGVCDKRTIRTVYNGVDTKKFKPGLDTELIKKRMGIEDEKVILSPSRFVKRTGAFHERKNLQILLRSLAKLKKEFKRFKVVFTGKNNIGLDKIMQEAKRLRIEDKVIFANIGFDDMPNLYNASDMVVLPSVGEAFGMIYIEGMACGKPVIGCNDGGVPEVIVNNKTGYLIRPNNIPELTKKMLGLLLNEKKSEWFGSYGRRLVKRKFDIDVIARRVEREYDRLLEKS